jgi:hypothetical protein
MGIVRDDGEIHARAERATEEGVEVEAEDVGGELRLEAGAEAADGLGAVALEVELLDELTVDGLDALSEVVDGPHQRHGQSRQLVAALGDEQGQIVADGEVLLERAVDIALNLRLAASHTLGASEPQPSDAPPVPAPCRRSSSGSSSPRATPNVPQRSTSTATR